MVKHMFYRTAAIAAAVGFVCLLIMFVTNVVIAQGAAIQPSNPVFSMSDFLHLVEQEPKTVLTFFAADSLFVLSYIVVFVGLYGMVKERSAVMAGIALIAGLIAALLDATENGFFITAVLSTPDETIIDQGLNLMYIAAHMKWQASFATAACPS